MSKLRCKRSESHSFIVAAEVLQPRAMLSAGATAAHALRHAASHAVETPHPAVTPPTFGGLTGAINGAGTFGNPITFAGTITISSFPIKRNATVLVTFSVTTNGTNLLIEGAYKFKLHSIVTNGTDVQIAGPKSSVSGHAGPDKISNFRGRDCELNLTNNNFFTMDAAFVVHSGKTKAGLFMTFDL